MTTSDVQFLDLTRLLYPRSATVIGASDRAGNLGGDTVRRLVKFGFPGPVWPVNRSLEPVAGIPAFGDVKDLPGVPDIAIFSIPASGLKDAIQACIDKGTRAGVAYAGGFAESGTAEGIALQNEIAEMCKAAGFMLCGPNCVGLINSALPVTSTFATALFELDSLKTGNISMVSQSGGIGTSALGVADIAGFGFRHLVSGGNEAVVSFADYLHAFALDEGTKVIMGYLEGLKDGPKFVAALEEARKRNKPVVLIKSGASPASARAAAAHTGALVGEDRVFNAILEEYGVIRVYSVEEAVDVALLLSGDVGSKLPRGRNVGVVTFGGGNGVLSADQCAQNGLATPELSPDCVAKLKPLLASVASASNPMDLTPTTAFRAESFALLPKALDVIAAEPDIHSVLFIVGSLASKAAEISGAIRDFSKRSPKPVVVSWPSPPLGVPARLAQDGIYSVNDYARGIRALSYLVKRDERLAHAEPSPTLGPSAVDWSRAIGPQETVVTITEDKVHAILGQAGLRAAPGGLATSAASAGIIADRLGYPVVLKGISPTVTHRAAAGLLAVGLATRKDVEAAYAVLMDRAVEIGAGMDGILVQKMEKGGSELLVAAFRDPFFGPMVSVGAGGGLTELIDDVVTHSAPVSPAVAAAMIERLRIRRHARDNDGLLPVEPAAAYVAGLSQLAATIPHQKFMLEVNPIKWTRTGATAVDGLLIVG